MPTDVVVPTLGESITEATIGQWLKAPGDPVALDEPIADADFDDLVLDVGLRGYRMSQVDGVIDRLRRELREPYWRGEQRRV